MNVSLAGAACWWQAFFLPLDVDHCSHPCKKKTNHNLIIVSGTFFLTNRRGSKGDASSDTPAVVDSRECCDGITLCHSEEAETLCWFGEKEAWSHFMGVEVIVRNADSAAMLFSSDSTTDALISTGWSAVKWLWHREWVRGQWWWGKCWYLTPALPHVCGVPCSPVVLRTPVNSFLSVFDSVSVLYGREHVIPHCHCLWHM